jgi:hypothetical protein
MEHKPYLNLMSSSTSRQQTSCSHHQSINSLISVPQSQQCGVATVGVLVGEFGVGVGDVVAAEVMTSRLGNDGVNQTCSTFEVYVFCPPVFLFSHATSSALSAAIVVQLSFHCVLHKVVPTHNATIDLRARRAVADVK